MAYRKHLRMLGNYHPGGLTCLPGLSTNVAHILKSRREIPSGFIKTPATASRTEDKPTVPPG